MNMENGISIGRGLCWTAAWFGFMLLYTALDVAVWRKISAPYGKYLNLITIIFCMAVFLLLLTGRNHLKMDFRANISLQGIFLSILCAVLFYCVLDKGLDPVFEKFFPASEESYQQTLQSLYSAPVLSGIQVCLLAPIIEEILMRGFLLGGLSPRYGKAVALLVSSFLFALLHFNMVQTLSAFVCGIGLGMLYLYTGSIACCIVAHAGYNLISYIGMIAAFRDTL